MSESPASGGTPQPEAQPAPAAPQPSAHGHRAAPGRPREGGFSRILRILFAPLIWVLRPLVFRVTTEQGVPKVYFTSFSTLIYLWPIMVVGWLGVWFVKLEWVSDPVMGWVWISVVWIVILALGADTDRNRTVVLFMVVLLLWLGAMLIEARQNIPVLSHVYDYLAARDVHFDQGTARIFSLIVFVILLFIVAGAWFDGRYEITTREITHKRLFRTSDSLPRAAKRIKRDWRDFTEVILGIGAGDVIVLDTQKNVVLRIPNVPFLWFFRHDVDHILEVLATTEADDTAAVVEEEERK